MLLNLVPRAFLLINGWGTTPQQFIKGKALGTRLDIAWVHKEEGTTLRARVFFFCGASRPHLIWSLIKKDCPLYPCPTPPPQDDCPFSLLIHYTNLFLCFTTYQCTNSQAWKAFFFNEPFLAILCFHFNHMNELWWERYRKEQIKINCQVVHVR